MKFLISLLLIYSSFALAKDQCDLDYEKAIEQKNNMLAEMIKATCSNPQLAGSSAFDKFRALTRAQQFFAGPMGVGASAFMSGQFPEEILKTKCEELKKDCLNGPPVQETKEFSDILLSMKRFFRIGPDEKEIECACIRQNLESEYNDSLTSEMVKEKERVNKKILEAQGRKFLNDFSTNFEDASFLLTKTRHVFKDQARAQEIQCNNPDEFNKRIRQKCDARGIKDEEFIQKRKDYFINSIDGKTGSFEERLVSMSDDMVKLVHPDTNKTYTRYQYDYGRMGLAHNNAFGKQADHIVKALLLNSGFKRKIIRKLRAGSPGWAILDLIDNESGKADFAKEVGFDQAIVGDILTDKAKLRAAFQFLINTHPGFLNAMENKNTFEKLAEEMRKNPDSSVLDLLETDTDILEPALKKKCHDLMENFAVAVCTKDEDLIGSTTPNDLNDLMKAENPSTEKKYHLHELLACENKNTPNGKSGNLSDLYKPDFPIRKSDYLERLREPDLKKHENRFSKFIFDSTTDPNFKDEFDQAVVQGQAISTSVPAGGVVAAEVHARAVIDGTVAGKPVMTKEEARTYIAEAARWEQKVQAQKLAGTQVQTVSQVQGDTKTSAPVPNTPSEVPQHVNHTPFVAPSTVVAPAVVKPRDELSSFLAKNNRPEEVKRTVEELTDRDSTELNKMKDQSAGMLAQTLKEETTRMELLQARIDELKKKLSDTPSVAGKRQDVSRESQPASTTLSNLNNVFTAPAPLKGDTQVKAQATATSPFGTQVGAAGVSAVPGSGRNLAVASMTRSSSGDSPAQGSLVLTVSGPIKGELSQEIRKQLENVSLDPKAIEELKTKGFVFRYSVMENNQLVQKEMIVQYSSLDEATKQLIELKSLEQQKHHQVSKLSVLRMLLK